MRIQLLCDHKWRDLPSIAVVRVLLQRRGHKVLVTTTKEAVALMNVFRPDAVVFNHISSAVYRDLARALKSDGRCVVHMPTEGTVRPEYTAMAAGEGTDYSNVDLHLPWSEPAAVEIRARWKLGEDAAPVAGCGRFDFYHPRFRSLITPREDICRCFDFDPARPIVTWATNYCLAHLHDYFLPAVWKQFEQECKNMAQDVALARIGISLPDYPRLVAEGRNKAADSFFKMARELSEIQFLIKPHPVEDREFYLEQVRRYNLKNVKFCGNIYIWDVLNITNAHLHRQCTTAIEAWLWDKPTIEMGMDNHPAWAWPEREAGSKVAHDAGELIELVRQSLGAGIDPSLRAYRDQYISRWFGPVDGRRCETAADLIDTLLSRRQATSWSKPLRGWRVPIRQQAKTTIGFLLNRAPGEPLLPRSSGAGQRNDGDLDKHIRRKDIVRYCSRVSPVFDIS